MSSMTPLHLASYSNRTIRRSTPRKHPEVNDPSSMQEAQSSERGDSKGETKKQAKLIVSHPYETNLTVKEKAARVAVVLSPIQKCGYKSKEGCDSPALERNNDLCAVLSWAWSNCNDFGLLQPGNGGPPFSKLARHFGPSHQRVFQNLLQGTDLDGRGVGAQTNVQNSAWTIASGSEVGYTPTQHCTCMIQSQNRQTLHAQTLQNSLLLSQEC
eukprot:scaffold12552_cov55-Attheya_sp.AAC.3